MNNVLTELSQQILEEYRQNITSDEPENIRKKRDEAILFFEKNGFPDNNLEEYKYTNLQTILEKRKAGKFEKNSFTISSGDITVLKHLDANFLVFVDGTFNPELSNKNVSGLSIETLSGNVAPVKEYYGNQIFKNDSLTSLNTALAREGAFIKIQKNVKLEKPLALIFFNNNSNPEQMLFARNLIIAEEGSQADIIEYHSGKQNSAFLNIVTEIEVNRSAKLSYAKVQDKGAGNQVNSMHVKQYASSSFESFVFSSSSGLIRNNLFARFEEAGSDLHMYGFYAPYAGEHTDNQTLVDHAFPNCYSNELYKGIIGEKGTAVFNGKILVREDAQKTNAYQRNMNLLLSDNATVNTKPQLEIFADDVKCSHGATTGQLDPESIFYLRSRGISEDVARGLLMTAFAQEIIEKVSDEKLRTLLGRKIAALLQRNILP